MEMCNRNSRIGALSEGFSSGCCEIKERSGFEILAMACNDCESSSLYSSIVWRCVSSSLVDNWNGYWICVAVTTRPGMLAESEWVLNNGRDERVGRVLTKPKKNKRKKNGNYVYKNYPPKVCDILQNSLSFLFTTAFSIKGVPPSSLCTILLKGPTSINWKKNTRTQHNILCGIKVNNNARTGMGVEKGARRGFTTCPARRTLSPLLLHTPLFKYQLHLLGTLRMGSCPFTDPLWLALLINFQFAPVKTKKTRSPSGKFVRYTASFGQRGTPGNFFFGFCLCCEAAPARLFVYRLGNLKSCGKKTHA